MEKTEVSTEKVKLWNPNAAANWSLLFSPIFGAWLQSKNWESLGNAENAKKSMYWVYAGFLVLLIALFTPLNLFFILLLAWYFASARKQTAYVKNVLNDDYVHKPWKSPMKFAAIGVVSFLIISLILPSGETTKVKSLALDVAKNGTKEFLVTKNAKNKDFKVVSVETIALSSADKANGIQGKWNVKITHLTTGSVFGENTDTWSQRTGSVYIEKSKGKYDSRLGDFSSIYNE